MNAINTIAAAPAGASLAGDQEAAASAIMAQVKALNAAITRAVDAGLIVEVGRASRYHNAEAVWGDQIAPLIQARG